MGGKKIIFKTEADAQDETQTEPLPVPYRYDITGNRANMYTVFKPSALGSDESGDSKTVRPYV